jgi:hypothetical protein
MLIGGILACAIIAAGAVGLAHLRRQQAVESSLAGASGHAPVLVLVAEGGHVAVDRAGGASPAAPAAGAPTGEAPAAPSAEIAKGRAGRERPRAATAKSAAAHPAPHGGAQSATAFSTALARRGSELRACVAANTGAASDDSAIEFRFRIRADGHVESVSVFPEALGRTPLGACLVKVGAGTVFAPQPEPIAFRIPLSLRVHQVATNHGP